MCVCVLIQRPSRTLRRCCIVCVSTCVSVCVCLSVSVPVSKSCLHVCERGRGCVRECDCERALLCVRVGASVGVHVCLSLRVHSAECIHLCVVCLCVSFLSLSARMCACACARMCACTCVRACVRMLSRVCLSVSLCACRMYACIYGVSLCLYVSACQHVRVSALCASMRMCICACARTCTCTCVRACVGIFSRVCVHVCTNISVFLHVYIHTHVHIHITYNIQQNIEISEM